MKHLLFGLAIVGLIFVTAPAFAETRVGEGIREGASAPGKLVEGSGAGVEKAGKFIQPETGNTVVDAVGGLPGKVVEGTGMVVGKAGEGVSAVTNSITGKPVSAEAKARMAEQINCDTAQQDLAALKTEQRTTSDRISNGVKSVLPITAAVRLLSGTYMDGVKVSAGTYNQDIGKKITEIEMTCNMG